MMESDYDYNYNTSDDECHLWEEEEQQNEEKKDITYQVQSTNQLNLRFHHLHFFPC